MERLTKRDTDGQVMMDCEKCKADWAGRHGQPMCDCTSLYCRNRLKNRLAAYEDTGLEPEEVISMQAAKVVLEASDAPAANAVAVVLCKDCKSCRKLNRKDRIEEAYADGVLWCTNQSDGVWPDDFCSYGERRGGGEDG